MEPVVSAANTEEIALSGEETSTLQLLLNELLDNGQLLEVTKVATHFRHPCQDLKIISVCINRLIWLGLILKFNINIDDEPEMYLQIF